MDTVARCSDMRSSETCQVSLALFNKLEPNEKGIFRILIARGANLLAVNADGNMPYDICEDEQALDYIESEMAKNGVTQQLIDETRANTERKMLADMRALAQRGEDLEQHDTQGATPVNKPTYTRK